MTIWETIQNEIQRILDGQSLGWTVGVQPPAGFPGPCVAISEWSLNPKLRTSLGEYPALEITLEISGLTQSEVEQAYDVAEELANSPWQSDRWTAFAGRLEEWRAQRDEAARRERFVGVARIVYQVVRVT